MPPFIRGHVGQRLYILAFDHRASFVRDLFGIRGSPSAGERSRVSDAKDAIHAAVLEAISRGAPRDAVGVLVDEEFGAAVARTARGDGLMLCMAVEKSGQEEFEFEYGGDWRAHLALFDPDFGKVLVRYNPEGDAAVNERQTLRLAQLSSGLREDGRGFLFELLVPPTAAQLMASGGDQRRYDRELRPRLVEATIETLQDAGVEPQIWKIEGLDRQADCEAVLTVARRGNREVDCIVLGRGADQTRLESWLRHGAAAGFAGFAIGRTIWLEPLGEWQEGRISRAAAQQRIADNYLRAIEVFQNAAT